MHNIIIEKPYEFRPPCRGTIWSSVIQRCNLFTRFLRRKEGVVDHEIRHLDRLLQSLQAGHGVLITPNHSRNADPLVMGWITKAAKCHVYAMASWHLFNQDWFTSWAIHKMGGFSVYREGIDRQAINMAVDILNTAERPLAPMTSYTLCWMEWLSLLVRRQNAADAVQLILRWLCIR